MYSTRAIMRQVIKCPQKSLCFRAACTVFNFNSILDTTIVCRRSMPFMAKAAFWKLRIQACFWTTHLTGFFWHPVNLLYLLRVNFRNKIKRIMLLFEKKKSKGQSPYVAIERQLEFKMPKPYSNCDMDKNLPFSFSSYLYNLIHNSGYDYSQQLCFNLCKSLFIIWQENFSIL